ncbi:uncharacterized protein IL334_001037 [Kwoniella shivajii]|uniref:Uncharacterized protein n=1 Tax=Kwoniella shivajii TaxID=564305 RepID=A0ABZ1CRF3_9TREE|nr:hypothetical protein IL334_001037 [Kwoniella shivajii]
MSFRRSNFGRFTSSTANESYQRQLTAPVNKWRKQWVSPTGLAPESSYKICKWVKQKEKAKLAGAAEGDDNTPAPEGEENEGDENDEGEDQEMDEDNQGDEEGEAEGEEGEGEGDGEAVPTATGVAAQTPVPGMISTETDIPTATSTSVPQPSEPIVGESGPEPVTAKVTETSPTAEQISSEPRATEEIERAPGSQPQESHEAPIPPHNPIPSNAIEITSVAPTSTETGLGTIGMSDTSVQLETRHAEDTADEKMDVEEPVQMEEKDKGLVHGEMEAPTEALEMTEVDETKEVEKEQM